MTVGAIASSRGKPDHRRGRRGSHLPQIGRITRQVGLLLAPEQGTVGSNAIAAMDRMRSGPAQRWRLQMLLLLGMGILLRLTLRMILMTPVSHHPDRISLWNP